MSKTYVSLRSFNVVLPGGKFRSYEKGQRITAAQWLKLPSSIQSRFETAGRAPRKANGSSGELVSDNSLLGLLLSAYEAGAVVRGAYSEVWGWVESELAVLAPFCHFRAAQIGRVGRKFESVTGVTFEAVCPDLRAVATAWSSALA